MGHLISCIKKIDDARFEPFPPRAAKAVKLVNVKGCIYALSATDTIYTNGQLSGRGAWSGTDSDHPAVIALKKLGIITEEERMRHGASARRRAAACLAFSALENIHNNLKKLGVEHSPLRRLLTGAKKAIDRNDLDASWLSEERIKEVLGE